MHYAEIKPSPLLAGYVKCFWVLKHNAAPGLPAERVMPDGCVEIVFNLADRFRRFHSDGFVETQPSAIVAGQMRTFAAIAPTGSVDLFGIRFRPAGAYPFFRFSLSELTGRIENLSNVWNVSELEEQLNESFTTGEKVDLAETALLKILAGNRKTDAVVERAAEVILNNSGVIRIEKLARSLDVSQRLLDRRFQQRFGLTPKFFARIVRFQNLVRALNEAPNSNPLGTALSFGYYDQAHLIHEFNQFAGESPSAFFNGEHNFSQFFITQVN